MRASCATVLYNDKSNIPEQAIAERTGHRSLAIRSYKRTKDTLKRKVSDILTDYSAGVGSEVSSECKKSGSVEPVKHNVKVEICLSMKE